jgi:hypothetical protein
MPRSYRRISDYEKEIIELREQGKPGREICEIYEFIKNNLKILLTDRIKNKIKYQLALR